MSKEAIELLEKVHRLISVESVEEMIRNAEIRGGAQDSVIFARTRLDQALAILKEQPPAGDVFEIRIPNLKPDEVEIVRVEINAFAKQLLNNLQARRRTN